MSAKSNTALDLRSVAWSSAIGQNSDTQPLQLLGYPLPTTRQAYQASKEEIEAYKKEVLKKRSSTKKQANDFQAEPPNEWEPREEKSLANWIGDRVAVVLPSIAIGLALFLTVLALSHNDAQWLKPLKSDNLSVSVTFFWIELFAIVLGFRYIDRTVARRARREAKAENLKLQGRYLYEISTRLFETISEIQDARGKFIDEVIDAQNDQGSLDSDKIDKARLNRTARECREKYFIFEIDDDKMPSNVRAMTSRIFQVLGRMVDETYSEGGKFEEALFKQSQDIEAVWAAFNRLLECSNVETQGLQRLYDTIKSRRLDLELEVA